MAKKKVKKRVKRAVKKRKGYVRKARKKYVKEIPETVIKKIVSVTPLNKAVANQKFVSLPPQQRVLKTEKDIAMDFAEKVHRKFDKVIKASILFGSQVKGGSDAGSDIDVILIVDDAAIEWDLELVAWYREELGKLISRQKYGAELHVNTVKLTTWWEDLLHGDPVVINILRYGEALIDYAGFFNPVKALLLKGKMRSTPEAASAALQRAPGHIIRSKMAEMSAIEGAYWAMVDSAQAALMTAGKMPPNPEQIPELLKETFVDAGMLKMGYVKGMKELYSLHKAITHRQMGNMKGQEIDEWQELAEKFLVEMTRIVGKLLEEREK
ncbi:MAG: nucleotidyltransferase domain-containing protein [Nanoarchaeota archaeon]|nr:nucleotidyltransferase domain-containing protein [Nanoarchaeota archaeon]MBU1051306.1 nucleotidyltransferase domain-containing protein [Nanoarchaeota archaeon]MBU1988466.1 nucleotidyltransferase domain-containing protein [Nanoarchaeota archaeon]